MNQRFLFLVLSIVIAAGCGESAVEEFAAEGFGVLDEPARPEIGDMILIPAGEFIMGSDEKAAVGGALAAPQRPVDLPAYWIDAYEVTNGQWIRFLTESGFQEEGDWRRFYSIGKEDFPVTNVTWDDAKAYAEWAGKRLPTEAEWEKAARGTDGRNYPWGDSWDPSKSNCNEAGIRNTVEVGRYRFDVSPFGVYDMMGNVQEWTGEMLRPYPASPARNDDVFRQPYVAVRGGSYAMKGGSMKIWTRSGYFAKSQYGIGFRCARDATEEEIQSAFKWDAPIWAVLLQLRRVALNPLEDPVDAAILHR